MSRSELARELGITSDALIAFENSSKAQIDDASARHLRDLEITFDVRAFINARLLREKGADALATQVYEAYCAWCERKLIEPVALPTFSHRMTELLSVKRVRIKNSVFYKGIALLDESVRTSDISVPPQKPAGLEAKWEDGRITPSSSNIPSDTASLGKGLKALKKQIDNFRLTCSETANIDKRFCDILSDVSKQVPEGDISQEELFGLGHWEEFFHRYRQTVSAEWPTLLAARYDALTLLFCRTLDQYADWKQFKKDAGENNLLEQEVPYAAEVATRITEMMKHEPLIDPKFYEALRRLSRPIAANLQSLGNASRLMVSDVLESLNNLLKAVADRITPLLEITSKTVEEVYLAQFRESASDQLKEEARKDGRAAVKLLKKLIFCGIGVGAVVIGEALIEVSTSFLWLQPLLHLLR